MVAMREKRHNIGWIEWGIYATIAALTFVAQATVGNFPLDIFSFPLNIITMGLWLTILHLCYRQRSTSHVAKALLAPRATWISLGIMAAIGLHFGLSTQPNATSWSIVTGIFYTLSHLTLVIMRGWRNAKGIRWRFLLTHCGLWLALGAGFWGAPDREQMRMALIENRPTNKAYHTNGEPSTLSYKAELIDLSAEYSPNGMPTHFETKVVVDNEQVTLRVNHPYNRTLSEKIYLVSIGNDPSTMERYAIIEIVREPWQWLSMAGIVMLMAGAVMLFVRGPRNTTTEHATNKDRE